jgi:hypothetical protein
VSRAGRSLAEIAGSKPVGAWMSVSCECCLLSDRGLCFGLITRPEESAVCLSVIVKLRKWESPGPLGAVQRHKKNLIMTKIVI